LSQPALIHGFVGVFMRPNGPSHVQDVIALFDLAPPPAKPPAFDARRFLPKAGQLVLLTGPSGAGKTTLLRSLRKSIRRNRIDLDRITLPRRPVIDCFDPPATFCQKLSLLSRVGLAEAHTYLRRPEEISEGQRFRLRLAIALHRSTRHTCGRRGGAVVTLLCDEFAAPLDDITAAVAGRALRRAIDASESRLSAVVATGREQLAAALAPDLIVRCDFGCIDVIGECNGESKAAAESARARRRANALIR